MNPVYSVDGAEILLSEVFKIGPIVDVSRWGRDPNTYRVYFTIHFRDQSKDFSIARMESNGRERVIDGIKALEGIRSELIKAWKEFHGHAD